MEFQFLNCRKKRTYRPYMIRVIATSVGACPWQAELADCLGE